MAAPNESVYPTIDTPRVRIFEVTVQGPATGFSNNLIFCGPFCATQPLTRDLTFDEAMVTNCAVAADGTISCDVGPSVTLLEYNVGFLPENITPPASSGASRSGNRIAAYSLDPNVEADRFIFSIEDDSIYSSGDFFTARVWDAGTNQVGDPTVIRGSIIPPAGSENAILQSDAIAMSISQDEVDSILPLAQERIVRNGFNFDVYAADDVEIYGPGSTSSYQPVSTPTSRTFEVVLLVEDDSFTNVFDVLTGSITVIQPAT